MTTRCFFSLFHTIASFSPLSCPLSHPCTTSMLDSQATKLTPMNPNNLAKTKWPHVHHNLVFLLSLPRPFGSQTLLLLALLSLFATHSLFALSRLRNKELSQSSPLIVSLCAPTFGLTLTQVYLKWLCGSSSWFQKASIPPYIHVPSTISHIFSIHHSSSHTHPHSKILKYYFFIDETSFYT